MIALCGKMGAGKSTAARYLAAKSQRDAQVEVLSFTEHVFNPILKALEIQASREAYQGLGEVLMRYPGEEQLVKALVEKASGAATSVLDDVRYPHTLDIIRSLGHVELTVVFIDAPDGIRYERLRVRDGLDSMEEMRRITDRVTESRIEDLEQLATHRITNAGSLADFQGAIDRVFHV